MKKPIEPLYSVAFHHLSSDAKRLGPELPDTQLHYLSLRQIRTLLESAAALASTVLPPAEPELRITGETGKFVIQLRAGNLNFVSWSTSRMAGGQLTPTQIVATIAGESTAEDDAAPAPSAGWRRFLPSMNIGLMAVAIVAVNAFTLWFVFQPPRTLTPKFTLMPSAPAERLLKEVAGVYETGAGVGDRRLEIKPDGAVQRIKFGANRAAAQKQTYTVKPAEASGKPALVLATKNQSLITINDAVSVVLYGDTYRRIAGGASVAQVSR
jgi:hypothetical protein